jgi:thioredoxin-related protein
MKTILAFLLLFSTTTFSQEKMQSKIPAAAELLAPAIKQAEDQQKNVMVIFHASWCGWCKKMDAAMNDPLIKNLFTDNYITVHLTVLENEQNKNLENKGAFEVLKKYNGREAGLPFFVILNHKEELLATSFMRPPDVPLTATGYKSNTGCPAEDDEIAYFVRLLKATSRLDDAALQLIATRFSKNKRQRSSN